VSVARGRADVLREARKKDSMAKRARVLAVVDEMKASDQPITFLGVARAAEVSNWLVYASGVREHIETARKAQQGIRRRDRHSGASASAASLAVDLELARAELRRTRYERDQLKAKVQRALGQQIDQSGTAELEQRIRELGGELRDRDDTVAQAHAEREKLQQRLDEAEDRVGALRQSLRQMMREQSQ
jgi:chromosome segregation ATPase